MTFKISGTVVITNDRLVNNISGASGSRPASPVTGQLFFNTTSGELEVWNGSAWKGRGSYTRSATPALWGAGFARDLGLGGGYFSVRSSPVQAGLGITNWTGVSSGSNMTSAIRSGGTAWAWGANQLGGLGNNSTVDIDSPVSVVGGFTDWVQVSASFFAASGIRANGTAWCWGRGDQGGNGNNSTENRSSPVSVVGGFTDWTNISRGYSMGHAVRANGTLWGWGVNYTGSLGIGITGYPNNSKSSPVSVVGGFTDWRQVTHHLAGAGAVRANGTAWTWGADTYGEGILGNNSTVSRSSPVSVVGDITDWIQISGSRTCMVALRASGSAWAWGLGANGRLGNNSNTNRSSPVSVVGGFTDWTNVSASRYGGGGVRANGTAWNWGYSARLGTGYTSPVSSPVSMIGGFTDWVFLTGIGSTLALRSQPRPPRDTTW